MSRYLGLAGLIFVGLSILCVVLGYAGAYLYLQWQGFRYGAIYDSEGSVTWLVPFLIAAGIFLVAAVVSAVISLLASWLAGDSN